MLVANEMENPDAIDPSEYLRQKDEYENQRDTFMRKQLRRVWPIRIVRILGVFQLAISLAILGVDLPIILMFAPRWQVFAGCWTFLFGFIACVSTFHSTRKMTWLKLKWAVALNIIAGLAAAVMTAFDILFLVNPYLCVNVGGCNYLWYTYSAVSSFYVGQVILGIALLITAFLFLVLFIKYGIGGTTLFENIEKGWAPAIFKPMTTPHGTIPVPQNPATGQGVAAANARYMPRYAAPPQQYPNMPRYPPPPQQYPGMQRYPPPPQQQYPGMPPYPPPHQQYPGMPPYPPPQQPYYGVPQYSSNGAGVPTMVPGQRPPMSGHR